MGYRLSIGGYQGGGGSRIVTRRKIIIAGVVAVVLIILAYIGGYLTRHARKCKSENHDGRHHIDIMEKKKFYQKVADTMKTENLRANLRFFAKKPHVASFKRTDEIADEIFTRFRSYGFDTNFYKYNVLLSLPDPNKENYVAVFNNSGQKIFQNMRMEKIYEPKENDKTALPPFLAYGKNGEEKGDLVYANYGRKEDFKYLNKSGVKLNGTIALVRYGKVGRGSKVSVAASFGCVGVLIYGDPKDYAPGPKFPKGRWLPDDGVQRGSIMGYGKDITEGDPMTRGYPAKDWVYRPDIKDVKGLPLIPAQPIAASDAQKLLGMLTGSVAPKGWAGGLNITYRTGGLQSGLQVDLKVNNKLSVRPIRNICGTIKGSLEPDRYVLLGNHIDAWVFGAVDASSGTTVMMEIARALGEQLKQGWLPRRTIRLCGWNGEEFNLIGSVEYVEEFYNQLRDQAVAYINIDSAVAGNYSLQSAASPLLHNMMFDVHRSVPDPYKSGMTVFDKACTVYKDKYDTENHLIYPLGAGSDYYAFYKFVGIPSIDIGYRQKDLDNKFNTSYYPMYHTLHDTVYWMENFVDKEYKIHLTVAKVGLQYLLYLADLPVLPISTTKYGNGLRRAVKAIVKKLENTTVSGNETKHFLFSSGMFETSMTDLDKKIDDMVKKPQSDLKLRVLNDKLMQLEKGFTFPSGLPGRPQIRHYVMEGSSSAVDSSYPFPAICDLFPKINETNTWKEIRKQISITTTLIDAVRSTL